MNQGNKLSFNLERINTTQAEINFKRLINQKKDCKYQTFFLNGVWGSGKTSFLENINTIETDDNEIDGKEFIFLKIWEIKDERSIIEQAFHKLHPIIFWILKLSIILAIVISILASPTVNLGLGKFLPSYLIKTFIILSLGVSVNQLLKVKSDAIYAKLILYNLNRKVLVIDDFDRLSESQQNESYKLFNILHGKIPIVFVGDYQKIMSSTINEKFLQKIIDRRLELPSALNSKNIWNKILQKISQQLDIVEENYDMNSIIQIIAREDRSLREIHHFMELLQFELFEKGKFEIVNHEQLVTIIYTYLFYPKLYEELKNSGTIHLPNEIKEKRKEESKKPAVREKELNELIYEIMLEKNPKSYPRVFRINKEAYFVDEYIGNLSLKGAEEIFKNKLSLQSAVREGDSDFLSYLEAIYFHFQNSWHKRTQNFRTSLTNNDFQNYCKNLEKIVFSEIKINNSNSIISFVVDQLYKKIFSESREDDEYKNVLNKFIESDVDAKETLNRLQFRRWENYTSNFTLSEKIKFHVDFRIGDPYMISYLERQAERIIEDDQLLKNEPYKSYIYFLIARPILRYERLDESIKIKIRALPDKDIIEFWRLMGLIEENKIIVEFKDLESGKNESLEEVYDKNRDRINEAAKNLGISLFL